jgi:exo-beta-1,3-glucanase (GH17 family)
MIIAGAIGINYGLNGDNLPAPPAVVGLYERCHIPSVRLFEPRPEVLQALRGKPLQVILGTRNEDIQSLATTLDAANSWVAANIVPYRSDVNFTYITVGNEAIPGAMSQYIAQAIANMYTALADAAITYIKVSTVVPGSSLSISYPPSAGAFTHEAAAVISSIAPILLNHGASLMLNVYPYFAYASDTNSMSLDYALLRPGAPLVRDQNLVYDNIFDAMVDAFYAALEKISEPGLTVVISESGWPTAGNEPITSPENARTYNRNLLNHVQEGRGTPRRPGQPLDVYFFAMFNEDLKQAGIEQHWGFFYPNMQPVYPFWQCS